ncbi:cytochrome c oxidase subunit I [Noviherbaspirillum sp. 17J57-3]|uniref:Cytochrome c oxidase subunit 1 n=1 Tax=Noviherbaspirillum galbum TaxID=2709383 RepID=A0A6B3SJV7_9BURK|nr:cytochrome c oxidase subunit I [Noviherbaspirillum galbum]
MTDPASPADTRVPQIITGTYGSPIAERLETIWKTEPGILGWIGSVDHKEIGKRYLVTAMFFLLVGGLEALALRVQLAAANLQVLNPRLYNELFTMHGMTMVFLYALPILSGFSNYLWPLLLGSRDMAFPRLNAFSYWVYLAAGLFMYAGMFFGQMPDAGWFNYTPYSNRHFNPGLGIDIYALGMVFLGISTTVGAINFVVTLLRTKAPGMSINRVPIIIWGTLTASVGNLLAVPAVSLAFLLLWAQRQFGAHYFDPAGGGQPLLWQHLFWMFGHPWVYAIVLPAMGIVSDALPVFCRRPLVGYTPVALSTVATMFIGFGVWVHHMFATGLSTMSLSFFSASSIVIVIPSAVAVFAWLATIFTGRPVFKTPFYYFAGFVFLFTLGGVSGFMTASVPADLQLTDTYFVVAHLHYVLLGINVFPVLGGIVYWFPKMTGKLMDERLGKWSFWILFAGFNIAFFPMHVSGLLGMPRRVYTYPSGMGWELPNLITSAGSFLFALGVLLFLVNLALSLKRGAPAGNNPWDANTLEWSMPSPPPPYNFVCIPELVSRHPLWEDRLQESEARSSLHQGMLLDHGRETIGTTALDSEAEVILKMPGDSVLPFLCTLALSWLFVAALLHQWWLAGAGAVCTLAAGVAWLWPRAALGQTAEAGHG